MPNNDISSNYASEVKNNVSTIFKGQYREILVVVIFLVILVAFDRYMNASTKSNFNELNCKVYNKCIGEMPHGEDRDRLESSFETYKAGEKIDWDNLKMNKTQHKKSNETYDYAMLFFCDKKDIEYEVTKERLMNSRIVNNLMDVSCNSMLKLFVVYSSEEANNNIEYPNNWIICHSSKIRDISQDFGVSNNIWLIDKYERVVLKNASLEIAEQWLSLLSN